MTRRCGDCQLCCKLLPMKMEPRERFSKTVMRMIEVGLLTANDAAMMSPDFPKPAGKKCPHQQHGKGCAIYATRPLGCRIWNCRWLTNEDTGELSRPDRAHYVIDIAPDYITKVNDNTGEQQTIPVIQVWLDTGYPDAHRDPKLRAYLDRRGAEGHAALIRTSSKEAFVLFPPSLTGGEWVETESRAISEPEHTPEEKHAALGPMRAMLMP